ncbi:MAG: hypothetical protein ACO1QB_17485 [Verrucomicrobiales bacterium]
MTIKKDKRWPAKLAALACSALALTTVHGQSQVLFSDDFEGAELDTTKWRSDDRPFESGVGDIQPYLGTGTLLFQGTVLEQYWPGAAIATVPTFQASIQTNLVVTVDRVSEFGSGTASRSALWITDETRSNYIVFADVRAEGGWRYNRKINQPGDAPNGSGIDIAAFNGGTFDDGGLHQMRVELNGQTAKLYLDDVLGAEVAFPYTSGITFQLGSYARANNDLAYTEFDNFQVAAVGAISFSQESIRVRTGENSANLTVRIPQGSNATQPVQVQVVSSNPDVATPVGGTAGTLTLTFAAGGPTSQTVQVRGVKSGSTEFTLSNNSDLLMANRLQVEVPFPIGTVFEETFSGPLDTTKWTFSQTGFEAGTSDFEATVSNGQLVMSGGLIEQYWGGASIRTVEAYAASRDQNLVFEVDRVSMERSGTAGRSGIWITSEDRSQWIYFSQNHGENGWTVNVQPGTPTGGGNTIAAFNTTQNDLLNHRLKLVANGENVTVYLDNVAGGTFPFPVRSGIHFEIGAYARALGDIVTATFDNARVSTTLPCTTTSITDVTTEVGVNTGFFDVIIPRLLNEFAPATVTVTSANSAIAVPEGASNGALTLTFAAGATNVQRVVVRTVGEGLTTFNIVNNQGGCVTSAVDITVTPSLRTLLSDSFTGTTINEANWVIKDQPFEGGTLLDSTVTQENGVVNFHVTPATDSWPGYSLGTVDSFSATAEEPLIFSIDRVSHVGTGASTRTGVWITDASRANFVFFSYDDNNMGWQVNRQIGQAGDNPIGAGSNIAAFDPVAFNDGGNHRLKIVADGSTAKFYVDDVLGVEVPFPFANGIKFEFGAYARTVRDVVDATFDNALIQGPLPCVFADVNLVTLEAGAANATVTLTVPSALVATTETRVVVTSSNPAVASPVGGSNGALTLVFPAGGSNQKTFQVQRGSAGIAQFSFSSAQGLCSVSDVTVVSLGTPDTLLTDDLESGTLDETKWNIDTAPFEVGAVEGTLELGNSQVEITVTATGDYWGGYGLTTDASYSASLANPLTFEVDRTYLNPNASTGARSAIWILDSTGTNWVMFADLIEASLGWTYNRKIGQAGDTPTGGGVNMTALDGPTFDDFGLHRVRLVANGSVVRFYLDDILGAEVPFPYSTGLRFRIGSYARATGDVVTSGFDNVSITGTTAVAAPELDIARDGNEVVITWEGSGVLEQAEQVTGPWTTVANAQSGYRTATTGTARFFRLKR